MVPDRRLAIFGAARKKAEALCNVVAGRVVLIDAQSRTYRTRETRRGHGLPW